MPNMIHVRNKHSGETTTVNEAAYGHFAADFERIEPPVVAKTPKIKPSGPAAPKVKE